MITLKVRIFLVGAALTFAGAVPAAAAPVVATGPQYQASGSLNQCFISNPGDKDVKVPQLELVSQGGGVLASSTDLVVGPGAITSITFGGGGITFCRVVGVSAKKIRLTHCVRPNTGSPCTSITTGQ